MTIPWLRGRGGATNQGGATNRPLSLKATVRLRVLPILPPLPMLLLLLLPMPLAHARTRHITAGRHPALTTTIIPTSPPLYWLIG